MTSSSFFSFQEACRLSPILAIDGVSSRFRTRPVSSSTSAKRPLLGVALDPLGGEDLAALRVLQGRLDADLRPGAHEAADEGGRGLRLARHRLHDRGRHRAVVAVAGLVEQLVEAGGAQHAQAGRLRQVRDQHVGQAGAQPVELRVAGEVVEVEDGHRAPAVLRGGGRLAAEEERGHRRHDHERRADRGGQRPAAPARGRGDEPRAARGRAEDQLARCPRRASGPRGRGAGRSRTGSGPRAASRAPSGSSARAASGCRRAARSPGAGSP